MSGLDLTKLKPKDKVWVHRWTTSNIVQQPEKAIVTSTTKTYVEVKTLDSKSKIKFSMKNRIWGEKKSTGLGSGFSPHYRLISFEEGTEINKEYKLYSLKVSFNCKCKGFSLNLNNDTMKKELILILQSAKNLYHQLNKEK